MRLSFAIAAPLIAVYAVVGGAIGAAALIVSGAALVGTFGVSLVMSQEYMPSRVGLASGLSIGMAIGLGGIAALSLGGIADVVNIETAVLADRARAGDRVPPHVRAAAGALTRRAAPSPSRRRSRLRPWSAPS